MKNLERLLTEGFEVVEFKFRKGYAHPLEKIKFEGQLLSPKYTEYEDGNEGVYLGPRGSLLCFRGDEDEVGKYIIYTNFMDFKGDCEIDEDLYYEVAYAVGYDERIKTRVLNI